MPTLRWLLPALLALPALAEAPNLLENGGFETWAALDEGTARREDVRNVELDPPGQAPWGWVPLREASKGQARTARIALDRQVKHSGEASVRIENRDMRDISLVGYSTERFAAHADDPHNVRPNRRYLLRWWVKGEAVEPSGTGPILMLFTTSERDGKTYRTNTYESDPLPKGTFDWQERRFIFITDADARWTAFSLQLRWTAGTVWYDDVSLTDLGAVVPVETY